MSKRCLFNSFWFFILWIWFELEFHVTTQLRQAQNSISYISFWFCVLGCVDVFITSCQQRKKKTHTKLKTKKKN